MERILDDNGAFVSVGTKAVAANPYEKEVLVMKTFNEQLKVSLRNKTDELKATQRDLAECQGKFKQLEKEFAESKTSKESEWQKRKKQK